MRRIFLLAIMATVTLLSGLASPNQRSPLKLPQPRRWRRVLSSIPMRTTGAPGSRSRSATTRSPPWSRPGSRTTPFPRSRSSRESRSRPSPTVTSPERPSSWLVIRRPWQRGSSTTGYPRCASPCSTRRPHSSRAAVARVIASASPTATSIGPIWRDGDWRQPDLGDRPAE